MMTATPTISARGAAIGSAGWVIERVWNAIGTLAPLSFLRAASEWARAGFGSEQMPALFGAILRYEYDVLPGAVTTVLSLVLLARFWPKRKQAATVARTTEERTPASRSDAVLAATGSSAGLAVLVSLCAFAGAIIVHPGLNRTGLAAESLEPVVVLLLIIAARGLVELPAHQRLVVAALVLEFALTRGLHTLIVIAGIVPTSSDPNLALKLDKGITFIADMVTWEKGGAVVGMVTIWLALGWWLVQCAHTSCSQSDM